MMDMKNKILESYKNILPEKDEIDFIFTQPNTKNYAKLSDIESLTDILIKNIDPEGYEFKPTEYGCRVKFVLGANKQIEDTADINQIYIESPLVLQELISFLINDHHQANYIINELRNKRSVILISQK